MTSVLSCLVATIALAADPGLKGLPFGIPPAPEDPVISHVAPPQCLFYVNWAGTASPSASSSSETEKLLSEPEVQEFFNGLSKVFAACMRSQDDEPKEPAAIALSTPLTLLMPQRYVGGQTLPNTCYLQDDVPCVPAGTPVGPLPPPRAAEPAAVSSATTIAPPPAATEEKPKFNVSAQDYGDSLSALLTHPTAIFVTDVKVTPFKLVKKKARNNGPSEEMPGNTKPEAKEAETSDSPNIEIQAGMVVSLGPDAARLHAKFIKYLKKARKAGADADFAQIKIDGKPWYRSKPSGPGDKNRVTFGFHGKYFVVGVGRGAVEGILARWNSPTPAWLAKALEQTQVPRRTGIIYLNLKALRDKLLPLAPSKIEALAVLKLLGLDNVDSLISTTGLEDYGMINRVHLALDGKPRGLLDMVADRPLAAKDLEPIPSDALLAVAARVDLDRVLKALIAAYETAAGDADARKAVEEMKKEYGVDVHRFLSSLGDTWCVYNSPTEGEIAFLGWTAVVPVRDRAALLESWEKLCAAEEKKEAKKDDAKDKNSGDPKVPENTQTAEFCKCRFAGHEIYYVAGAPIAPAFYVSDREMVMTLNMPAMKAYLARKDHRSLATLPGVALALNDQNRPVALGYCDTPKLFDFLYPLISLYATMGAAAVHEAKIDLDPTFWPSAPAIRAHLRPDITTVERTPHGLQLTCRYCLPTGGANGPLWLIGLGILGSSFSEPGNLLSLALPSLGCATPCTVHTAPPALPATPSYGPNPSSGGVPYGTSPPSMCYESCPSSGYTTAPVAPSYGASAIPASAAPPLPAGSNCAAASGAGIGTNASAASTPPSYYGGYGAVLRRPGQRQVRTALQRQARTVRTVRQQQVRPRRSAATRSDRRRTVRTVRQRQVRTVRQRQVRTVFPQQSRTPAQSQLRTLVPQHVPTTVRLRRLRYLRTAPAANPSIAGAATIPDVVAMIRCGVDESLVINHIRLHGLAAPLRATDVIYLHQQGVSRNVIAFMQAERVAAPPPTPAAGNSSPAAGRYAPSPTPAAPKQKTASPPAAAPAERLPWLVGPLPSGLDGFYSHRSRATTACRPGRCPVS